MPMSDTRKTVAIIGAGIVGVSSAIWLQRDGFDVVLIDRAGPGEGASFGNGGVLASCSIVPVTVPGLLAKAPRMLFDPNQPLFLKWGYLPRLAPWLLRYLRQGREDTVRRRAAALAPLIGDSLADHQALAAGTGAERWVVPSDYLFLYNDRRHYEGDGFGWSLRRDNGFDWEVLEGDAVAAYDPAFGPGIGCAVRVGNHGRISDPGAYVKALAAHVEAAGGRILTAEVTGVIRENGAVTGLRAGGETISCDAAVLACGAWSGPLARAFGIDAPLESERGYHLELWEPSVMPRVPVMVASGKFVATPMEGRLLERNIRAAIPGITWTEKTEWMGHRPSMVDSIPVIGAAPGLAGGYAAFGHDHVGLTGGPKTGRLLAQLIAGRQPNVDLTPYDPARFARAGTA